MFNTKQIKEVLELIDAYNFLYIGQNFGSQALSYNERALLVKYGFEVSEYDLSLPETAFRFGLMAETLGDKRVKNMNYKTFKKYLKEGKFIPLNESERIALENVEYFAYDNIMKLANRIKGDVSGSLIEYNSKVAAYYDTAQDIGRDTIENRNTLQQFISDLGHKSEDWSYDHGRMADYISHYSYSQGITQRILSQEGDRAEVYFSVYKGACKHCVRLYLENGIGSKPKIFKLKDVISNGSNIGKKVADWKPVIPPIHPWCRCHMNRKREGYVWDEKTDGYDKPTRNSTIKRNSRAKIKIT